MGGEAGEVEEDRSALPVTQDFKIGRIIRLYFCISEEDRQDVMAIAAKKRQAAAMIGGGAGHFIDHEMGTRIFDTAVLWNPHVDGPGVRLRAFIQDLSK